MRTAVRHATHEEYQEGSGATHPFRLLVSAEDWPETVDEAMTGTTYATTREQLRRLARQIAELLDG